MATYNSYTGSYHVGPSDVESLVPDMEEGYGTEGRYGTVATVVKSPESTKYAIQAEVQMRKAFIRKVFGILCFQLLITMGLCAYMTFEPRANNFVVTHPGLAVVGIVMSFILLGFVWCYRYRHPHNMILLTAWTLVEAYTVGTVTAAFASQGQAMIVVEALGLTLTVFVVLTIFTMQSKIDFSFLGAALFASLWILVIWSLISVMLGWLPSSAYLFFGTVVFSLYVIFDVYLATEKLEHDDYIVAALNIYLDIVNLFLLILQLLARRD